MHIIKCSDRVSRITQIPNIDWWIIIIITCHSKLCRYQWVPHNLSLFRRTWGLIIVILPEIIIHTNGLWTWLCKIEYWFVYLEVPNNNFTVFTSTCKDVLHNSVPAYGSYPWTFVIIWYSRCKYGRLLQVLFNILNEHFRSTTSY